MIPRWHWPCSMSDNVARRRGGQEGPARETLRGDEGGDDEQHAEGSHTGPRHREARRFGSPGGPAGATRAAGVRRWRPRTGAAGPAVPGSGSQASEAAASRIGSGGERRTGVPVPLDPGGLAPTGCVWRSDNGDGGPRAATSWVRLCQRGAPESGLASLWQATPARFLYFTRAGDRVRFRLIPARTW